MGTVLIVDDDEDIRRLVARALGGHEVLEARDAKEALDVLALRGDPDLIVCDVMMPAVSGLDFVRHIRSEGKKHVPVVFLTAKSHPLDVVDGINAGARAYVTKPFKLAPLVARIERIIGGTR